MSEESPPTTDEESRPPGAAGGSYTWLIPIVTVVVVVGAVVVGLVIQSDLPAPDEIPEAPEELPTGEELYVRHCTQCHGRDGLGVARRYPPLVDTDWVLRDDERLILVTLYGLRGPIEVRGERYDDVMPGFSRHLSNEEAAILLTYIRTSWGNDGDEISADDVAAVRERYPPPDDPWTMERLDER